MWTLPLGVPSILTFLVRFNTSAVHLLLTLGWLLEVPPVKVTVLPDIEEMVILSKPV